MLKHAATASMVTIVLVSFLLSGCGLTAPRGDDGFANLDSPGMMDTNRTMGLSLGPTSLHFAARFLDDEPEIQALLRSLEGVRVRSYEVTGDWRRIAHNLQSMGDKLRTDGWTPVLLVHEDEELVRMYAKSSARAVRGLTVVSAGDDEVVVINIMGDIQPALFSDVMLALDIDDAPKVQIARVN